MSSQGGRRGLRSAAVVLVAAAAVAGLAACVPDGGPTSAPTQSVRPTNSGTPTPTPTKVPTIVTGGSAADNLPVFDYVNQQTFAAVGFVEGRPYIDALAATGFDRNLMELTWWDTPDGHIADSIFFSIKFPAENTCLLGQIAAWGYTGEVVPIRPTGSCMIGAYLQPIDW
jgi:hypothetical protein